MTVGRIQLVFPRHTMGQLSRAADLRPQPPLGLLTLAAYIRQELPDVVVEVYDGNAVPSAEFLRHLDAPVVGISVWFSNYNAGKLIAAEVKARHPESVIVMGGPHATALGRKILDEDPNVDIVVRGEGEVALVQILAARSADPIVGVLSRGGRHTRLTHDTNASAPIPDLDHVPPPALDALRTPYRWITTPNPPAMSAFPVSGIRGCMRRTRCEYCSIPTMGARVMSPATYWTHIRRLHCEHGIDYFFETGDIFPPKYARDLAALGSLEGVQFRVYSYPGLLRPKSASDFASIGVKVVFMGVESVLVWDKTSARRYPSGYRHSSILDEIRLLGDHGIQTIPAFILGLPGEDHVSLRSNLDFIRQVAALPTVREITASVALPLPGTELFDMCLRDSGLAHEYFATTGTSLARTDDVDVYYLSELLVRHFTRVPYSAVHDAVAGLAQLFLPAFASWSPRARAAPADSSCPPSSIDGPPPAGSGAS